MVPHLMNHKEFQERVGNRSIGYGKREDWTCRARESKRVDEDRAKFKVQKGRHSPGNTKTVHERGVV